MWLALVDRVAADHAAGAPGQVELLQQWIGEPARLVGHDAPGQAFGLERGEHLLEAREQPGARGEVLGVDRQEPLAQPFELVALCRWKTHGDQSYRAVRHGRAHRAERQRFEAFFLPQQVQRADHVRRGVEQRAVEVEQNGVGAGHAAAIGGSRRIVHEVVDACVHRQSRPASERIVVEAGDVDHLEPGCTRPLAEFGRADELVVRVRAGRQQAQHVLGAEDGHRVGLQRPVQRRDEDVAVRLHETPERIDDRVGSGTCSSISMHVTTSYSPAWVAAWVSAASST